jgi:very-short-patch-repair endonuclease
VSRVAAPQELTCVPFLGRDAVAAGLVTRRQLAGDAWRRLFPDVYAWAGLRLDHRMWCLAAGLLLAGRGAVSGRSAAALWGADVLVRGEPIEVTVPVAARVRAGTGLAVVRSSLPAEDVAAWAGIPVTSPVRTAFDLGRRLSLIEAVVALDAMLAARLVTRAEIARFARERPGLRGLPRLRAAIRLCDPGAESPMESRLRLLLMAGGLPRPVTQFEVRDPRGLFVARLDLAYPDRKLGVEYDGDHHRGRGVFQQDLRRLNALRACGWTVLRFASLDIYREPARVVSTVRAALAS